jgi:hypothetical protein
MSNKYDKNCIKQKLLEENFVKLSLTFLDGLLILLQNLDVVEGLELSLIVLTFRVLNELHELLALLDCFGS